MKESDIYTSNFKVRSYEVGSNSLVTLSSIANYFQEIAGLHANKLNFDITQLNENGLTWVLFKMNIIIKKFPQRWTNISVETWPSLGDRIRAFRDYRIYDLNNQMIGKANSQWMILDIQKKRPTRLPEDLMHFSQPNHYVDLDYSRASISIPATPSEDIQIVATVGMHHLDMNDHVNNVHYISWLTGYNHLQQDATKPNEISIQYINEAKLGDSIYLTSFEDKATGKLTNLLTNQKKEKLAIAEISFPS